jgi:hypothetical protein
MKSLVTSGLSPEEVAERLSYGIEWHMTEEGDLTLTYWQVGAEDFVPPAQVAKIRGSREAPREAAALEWVSRHLPDLRAGYPGQWVAIADDEVVASAANLSELLRQLRDAGLQNPLITEIPTGPIVWTTAYAG